MKKVYNIALNQLVGERMTDKELKFIVGGSCGDDSTFGYCYKMCDNGSGSNYSYCCRTNSMADECYYGK